MAAISRVSGLYKTLMSVKEDNTLGPTSYLEHSKKDIDTQVPTYIDVRARAGMHAEVQPNRFIHARVLSKMGSGFSGAEKKLS